MAVIVSFNGGQKVLRTIDALVGQVGHVHVVDNSSDAESLSVLRQRSRQPRISVSWLAENRGIGYALNVGIRIARKYGYRWLLTMDQDSIADGAMIQAYADVVDKDPSLACLTPQYSEHELEAGPEVRKVDYAITSGNLVRMDVFKTIGTYDEEFFIDCVDFDFSLRVRRAGFSIVMVGAARMQHALGDRECTIPVIGRVHTFHSPLRRYYIYRNGFYLTSRYAGEYPSFVCKLALVNALYLFTILLFGDQRLKSMRYIIYGLRDFLRNIKGPCGVE